jgi:hypothetical protein
MCESLWQEDARFNGLNIPPYNDVAFFWLSTGPTYHQTTFGAALKRQPGLNGFTISIESYLDVEEGDGDIETLFAGHYALDGAQ